MTGNNNNNTINKNNNNNFIQRLIDKTLGDKTSTYQSDNVSIQPAVTVDMIPYSFNTLESSINQKIASSNVVISSTPPLHSPSSLSPPPSSSSSMDNLKTNDNIIAVQKSTDNSNDLVNSTIELKEDKKVSKIIQFEENQIPHDQSDVLNSVGSSTSLHDKKPEVLVERDTTKKYEENNGKDHLIFRNGEMSNKEEVSEQQKELSEIKRAILSDSQYYHQGISKNNIATSSPKNSSSSTNINNQTIGKKGISPENSQKNNDNDVHIAYTTPFSLNRTKTADGINSNQIKNATTTTNMLNGNANDRTNAITSLPIFSDTQQQTEEKKFSNSDTIKQESSFIQPHPNYPSHSQILTNEKNQYIKDNKNEHSITVNIGRIDIRAIQQQQQHKLNSKVRRDTPESYYLTLRDYLKQRSTRSVAGL